MATTGRVENNIYIEFKLHADIVNISNLLGKSTSLKEHKFQVTNSLGKMGKGLASQFAQKYPNLPTWYKYVNPQLGQCLVYPVDSKTSIINLVSQNEIGDSRKTGKVYLKTDALEKALIQWRTTFIDNPPLVYIPYLMGCGLAGGDWEEVLYLIRKYVPFYCICYPPFKNTQD